MAIPSAVVLDAICDDHFNSKHGIEDDVPRQLVCRREMFHLRLGLEAVPMDAGTSISFLLSM